MPETGYFKSGDNELYYSCTIPRSGRHNVGVIFVHAAGGNRLGPHRMFVELAEELNVTGFPTLRFDLAGCGDSTGSAAEEDDINIHTLDVVRSVELFTARAGLDTVFLFGISKGAYLCLTAATNHRLPLAGLVLLSLPLSSITTAMKSVKHRLVEYLCKLTDTASLRKLVTGRADLPQISKTLLPPLKLRRRYKPPPRQSCASKCPVLLIYGQRDPIAPQSSKYYISQCRQNNLPYDCYFIPDANHSFFHYKWKQQIFEITQSWMKKITLQDTSK